MKRRNAVALSVSGVLVVALAAGTAWYFGLFADPSVADAPERDVPEAALSPIATGLQTPWGLAFRPDGSALVTERDSGRVLSIDEDGAVAEEQTIAEVRPGGEGGLLGIAVSPTYDEDQLVYVYYTADSDNRVARMRLGQTPEPILTGIPKAGNHDGGRLAFGPDGMLYVGTGDAGQSENSQNLDSLGGKILRLTPEGEPAPGNPFENSPVWSYGHRNVQGLGWSDDGTMFASEFGQNQYDELNRIEPGANYGWPEVEGEGGDPDYVDPLATWATSDASPSGIAVVGDHAYLACLRGTKLYRTDLSGGSPEALLSNQYGRLRHVAEAPDGSLWVITSNTDGRGEPGPDDDQIIRFEP